MRLHRFFILRGGKSFRDVFMAEGRALIQIADRGALDQFLRKLNLPPVLRIVVQDIDRHPDDDPAVLLGPGIHRRQPLLGTVPVLMMLKSSGTRTPYSSRYLRA